MEGRADAFLGVEGHGSPDGFDDRFRDAQPQSGTALGPCGRSVGLGEFLENLALEGFRNSRTIV